MGKTPPGSPRSQRKNSATRRNSLNRQGSGEQSQSPERDNRPQEETPNPTTPRPPLASAPQSIGDATSTLARPKPLPLPPARRNTPPTPQPVGAAGQRPAVGAKPLPIAPIRPNMDPAAPLRIQPVRPRANATSTFPPELLQANAGDNQPNVNAARRRGGVIMGRPPELELAIQQVQDEAAQQRGNLFAAAFGNKDKEDMTSEENDRFDIEARNRQRAEQVSTITDESDEDIMLAPTTATTIQSNVPLGSGGMEEVFDLPPVMSQPTPSSNTTIQPGQNPPASRLMRSGQARLLIPDVAQSDPNFSSATGNGLMSVEYFTANVKDIFTKEGNRSEDYNAVVSALKQYHQEVDSLKQQFESNMQKVVELGKKRTLLITEHGLASKKLDNLRFRLERLDKNLVKNAELSLKEQDDTKKQDLVRQVEEMNGQKAALEQEIEQALQGMSVLNKEIFELTKQADSLLGDATEQLKIVGLQKLEQAAKQVGIANQTYINKKQRNLFSRKTKALNLLKRQLEGNASLFRDISKAQEDAVGVPIEQQLSKASTRINTNTASEVFLVTIKSDGKHPKDGFAKKALRKEDNRNATTDNLDITYTNGKLDHEPNLIARQVISYRLDEALGLGVTAFETFSKDVDGGLLGVSGRAEVDGRRGVATLRQDGNVFLYKWLDYKNGATQKGLSDLQLMDALTGQLDRHMGNIFIEPTSGKVIAIDNDMAFPPSTYINQDKLTSNQLGNQFSRDGNGKLIYHQELIDRESAKRILAMTDESMRKLITANIGGESIAKTADSSIEAAIERLHAIKDQIRALEKKGALIGKDAWGDATYKKAIESNVKSSNKNPYSNYLARAVASLELAQSGTDGNEKIEP